MTTKWRLVHTKQAKIDANKFTAPALRRKAMFLLSILTENPYQNPPEYEKLGGDLKDCYARRINKQHRLVYQVCKQDLTVKIIRMWTHYE